MINKTTGVNLLNLLNTNVEEPIMTQTVNLFLIISHCLPILWKSVIQFLNPKRAYVKNSRIIFKKNE